MALFKSIAIIMGIQIFGWMFSLTAYNLVDNGFFSNYSKDTQILINLGINSISSLSSTCEVPALFLSSTEHRKALFKTFGYVKKSTSVVVINRNIMVTTQIMASSQVAPIRVG
uniref:G_PROTEIN_RECEP_F1_2 domain-containing protein n=1 Tax=Meloidogyne hapla TaxID=6305 RepID=A0A1I8BEQ7_MELHA